MSDNNNIEEDYLNDLLSSIMELENDTNERVEAMSEGEVLQNLDISDESAAVLEGTDEEIPEASLALDDSSVNFSEDIQSSEVNNDIVQENVFEEVKKEKKRSIFDELKNKNKEPKKMKEKKPKKEKKIKEKKPKKKKKEKVIRPKEPDEIIKIGGKGGFVIFSLMVLIIIFIITGVNVLSYRQNIDSAHSYYVDKKYDKAYEMLSGEKIKKSDQDFYNQLRMIMYVDKQYNSYKNFITTNMEPQALNSLIKGVGNYYKYESQAEKIGALSDMQYVKDQINAELKSKYNLTEDDAKKLSEIKDRNEYSKQIYDIVDNLS
jgi:hypothetical protein